MPEPARKSSGANGTGDAVGAGRGVLYIALAKIYFIVVGFVIQVALPALLSRATNGAYQVVNSIVSPFNNVVVTGTVQAVAKFTAAEPARARAHQRAGLRMHLMVGSLLAVAFVVAAPWTARFFWDQSKTTPLMLAGLIIGGYAFYAVFVGTANGLRWFQRQAGLDMMFATLRATGLIGMALVGASVAGVVAGWVAAVAVILVAAIVWVGWPRERAASDVRAMTRYFLQVAVYLLLFNCLMFFDVWLLKRTAATQLVFDAAGAAQVWPGLARASFVPASYELADVMVGYYASGQLLARLPYQLILAGTFVVFPLVSQATFAGDRAATEKYIRTTLQYSLLFALILAAPMVANPEGMLRVLFSEDYARRGAPALRALALGNIGFSLFSVAGTILNGAGLTRVSTQIAALTLALTAGLGVAMTRLGGAHHLLRYLAIATALAMIVGALLSITALARRFQAGLAWSFVARAIVAVSGAVAIAMWVPDGSKVWGLVGAVCSVALAISLLLVVGAISLKELRAAFKRPAAPVVPPA